MISGSLTKTSNETSSVTLDARNFVKLMQQSDSTNRSSITSLDENYELPEPLKFVISKNYYNEYDMQFVAYRTAKNNYLHSVYPNADNKIELEYKKDYSLASNYTIESGTTLVLKNNNLVLNGNVLYIKGNVEIYGRCNICNGWIIVQTTDATKDVFTTKLHYINDNENQKQEAQLSFNCVSIRCCDDGSSVSFITKVLGFPQNESSTFDRTLPFGAMYAVLFEAQNAPLKQYINLLNYEVRQFLVGLFILNKHDTISESISKIYELIDVYIKNSENGDGLKQLFFTTSKSSSEENTNNTTSNGLVEGIVNYMFTKPEIFKSLKTLLTQLDGKVSRFNNFIKFLTKTQLKFKNCVYHDNLNYNIGKADGNRLYGYHDFVTDKYIETEDNSCIDGVLVENSTFITTAFSSTDSGNTIFDLNGVLTVRNSKFILYGVYEFIANNFTDFINTKIYHTKLFENCSIELYQSDKFLEIDGGNIIFRNCSIQCYKPIKNGTFILFRRYSNTNTKKIRVYFENCQIMGDAVAGKNEIYSDDYCKIVVNKGIKTEDGIYQAAELYINNNEIVKFTNSNNRNFEDEDLYLYYSSNDIKSKTYYISAKQFNPFENDRLVEAN